MVNSAQDLRVHIGQRKDVQLVSTVLVGNDRLRNGKLLRRLFETGALQYFCSHMRRLNGATLNRRRRLIE